MSLSQRRYAMTEEKTPKRQTAKLKDKPVAEKPAREKTAGTRKVAAKRSAEMSGSQASPPAAAVTMTAPSDRQLMIEREAYLRAERRGFEPGHELEDWLAAEHSLGVRADA
ncbi:MAG: DUF2934 domain-containing protein [Pseudomonadota bacterium]|nr:DUF2934 domain-containing protein [Pseudomonadota bacterium]